MTDEPTSLESLMLERVELIGSLSQANAELMRLLQSGSGMEVLLMQQPQSEKYLSDRKETEERISSSQSHIKELEYRLVLIDQNIEKTLNTEV